MGDDTPPGKRRHTGRVSRYTQELAEAICRRIEAGETLKGICRDTSLPCCQTVQNWRTRIPAFRTRYAVARLRQREVIGAGGGRPEPGSDVGRYFPALGEAICARLAAGESLNAICADPRMPGIQTVLGWLDTLPDFTAAYHRARAHQAHAMADEVLQVIRRDDLAAADKQARLSGLKWLADALASNQHGGKPQADAPGEEGALIQIVVNGEGEGEA